MTEAGRTTTLRQLPDLLDFLDALNEAKAKYLVIGGHAVGLPDLRPNRRGRGERDRLRGPPGRQASRGSSAGSGRREPSRESARKRE